MTSIKWLVTEINNKIDFIPLNKWDEIRDIVQQAKEMHKQEIIDAYDKGEFDCGCNGSAEQYYNKTFKKD